MGEGRLRSGPDDLFQRGHHGDGLVGEVTEFLLEHTESVPVGLVETDHVVGHEGSETLALVVGIRGVERRLRHGVQEVPERHDRIADDPLELVEGLDVPRGDLHSAGGRRRECRSVGQSHQGQLFRVADRTVERQLLVEFSPERRERTRVILGRLADPVAADGAELAAHELDRVAVVLHFEEEFVRVEDWVDDADCRDVGDLGLH